MEHERAVEIANGGMGFVVATLIDMGNQIKKLERMTSCVGCKYEHKKLQSIAPCQQCSRDTADYYDPH